MGAGDMPLFDGAGGRKYVCGTELPRFLSAASRAEAPIRIFCHLLAFTGCRLSEARELTPGQIDAETGRVVFRTLKRRKLTFRAVPVPPSLLADLLGYARRRAASERMWPWCRQTAWRHVKATMAAAGIVGTQASPKGLRHGFGVANAQESVPMAITQKWLGHAKLETTAIYQQAIGAEERAFAERLWKQWKG